MTSILKKIFGKSVISVSLYNEETRQGINKAYIPKFLYKPPFGYPRYANVPYIRYLAKSPYVEMCISTIIDEISAVEWDIIPFDGMEEESDDSEIEHIRNFFNNPNTNHETFDDVFVKMPVRDVLEINSGVLNKVYNLKEDLVEVVARDGATFTKNPDIHGMFTDRADILIPKQIVNNPSEVVNPFQQMTGFVAREQAAYFQYGWIAGPVPVPFGRREIIWIEKMKRTDDHYGFSPVQILDKNLQTLIYAVENDLDYFNDNNVPKGIIGLEDSDSDEIDAFKEQWFEQQRKKDEFGNWRKLMHKVPIVNRIPKFERIEFSSAELEIIEKQKWWTKMVWSCYDDQTEILTESGWLLFKDLTDEKVARVNPKNLSIDYVVPEQKQEYDFDGELYHYKHYNIDLVVTPDHKMLYKSERDYEKNKLIDWTECQAKDEKCMYVPQAGFFEGEKIDIVSFTSENKHISKKYKSTESFVIDGDDFVEFMGFWLGDGWVETSNNRVVICASDVHPENIAFCRKILGKIAPNYKEKICIPNAVIQGIPRNINGMMHYFRFSNKAFSDYLLQFKKAYDKYIPTIIKNCSKNQRKLFFDSYMLADGCEGYKGRNDRYFSMSKRLIDDLQEMYVKEGIASNININNSNGGYELTVRKSKFKDFQNTSLIEKKHIDLKHYKGKVYDVTVPDHHFLVVRRNGRVCISGNCFGVTPTELGYTEDAKGSANQIVQSKVFRKKAINPILRLLEKRYNPEIVSEFGYVGFITTNKGKKIEVPKYKFVFKLFDVDEEKNKYELYKLQTETGIKTINEVRKEEGLDDIEWGDKPPKDWKESESSFNFGNVPNQNPGKPFNEREDDAVNPKEDDPSEVDSQSNGGKSTKKSSGEGQGVGKPRQEDGGFEYCYCSKCKKKFSHEKGVPCNKRKCSVCGTKLTGIEQKDNPLILREGEKPTGYKRIESSIKYVLGEVEKDVKKLISSEVKSNKDPQLKDLNDIVAKITKIFTVDSLKSIVSSIVRNNYMKGWVKAEKEMDKNFVPEINAMEFLSDYTFENIKGMEKDIANKLRQELQRGYMNGEGADKLKARVKKVFDVGENRAEMIARTESNRASNVGQLQAYQNSGEKVNKIWIAHFDDRTSPLCKRLDGQKVDVNALFKDPGGEWEGMNPPSHVNCRSTMEFEPVIDDN